MPDGPTRLPVPQRLPAVSPHVAAELARLLNPDLIKVRGCVLLPWSYDPESFEIWWERLNGDRARIEGVLNHLHLWDVFDADVEEAELRELAGIIAGSWRAAARVRFPGRGFEVDIALDGEDYGPTLYMRSADPAIMSAPP